MRLVRMSHLRRHVRPRIDPICRGCSPNGPRFCSKISPFALTRKTLEMRWRIPFLIASSFVPAPITSSLPSTNWMFVMHAVYLKTATMPDMQTEYEAKFLDVDKDEVRTRLGNTGATLD